MLKTYLQALLSRFYSKDESALVAHQAMPSTDSITLSTLTEAISWTKIVDGNSSIDGFLSVSAKDSGGGKMAVELESNKVRSSAVAPWSGGGSKAYIPVAKGTYFSVWGSGATEISAIIVRTVGRG